LINRLADDPVEQRALSGRAEFFNGIGRKRTTYAFRNKMRNRVDPRSAPDLISPSTAEAALRTFFQIARDWSLTEDEQLRLLGCSRVEYLAWTSGQIRAGLDHAVIDRLSHIFGIYSALQQLLPIQERANTWIRRANTAPLPKPEEVLFLRRLIDWRAATTCSSGWRVFAANESKSGPCQSDRLTNGHWMFSCSRFGR